MHEQVMGPSNWLENRLARVELPGMAETVICHEIGGHMLV